MKTSEQVTRDKLRGGFYSPESLVSVCLDRVLDLLGGRGDVDLLEPSAGDGQFMRGLASHPMRELVRRVTAVELDPGEAARAREALASVQIPGEVLAASVLDPTVLKSEHDVAVGNPPFVRFQFLTEKDRSDIATLGAQQGIAFGGVSNLWIPVFLRALGNLRDGGVFSFIVPAESLTGLSGRAVRDWLSLHATQLQIDLFPPKSFPGVLQEVVVLSGRITRFAAHGARVLVLDHVVGDSWRHVLDAGTPTWSGLLLRPEHLEAVDTALGLPGVVRLGEVAKLSVATVTGANDYFCVDDSTRLLFDLDCWTQPLLDRVRNAPGLTFTAEDHLANAAQGKRAWLLDSRNAAPASQGALAYLRSGEAAGLHTRYKTRIRSPWWQVPVVSPGTLMLSKRSNNYPRLIHNVASAHTTDTVYQGSPRPQWRHRERDIVGSFHNSLTLLTAELNGRSFGGGVLELVPSEISTLALPLVSTSAELFCRLDTLVRMGAADSDLLVEQTDESVTVALGIDRDLWRLVTAARVHLRDRRLARN